MGIKYLWTVLSPFCDKKPLYELQGKTVAVDLSCWVCEAQNIAEYQVQPRMYLRNLYFRTCYLLLMDVNPVFVLEGQAPELKYDTITARNALQFKGAKPKTDNVKTGKGRTRFNFVLKQCEDMLRHMGLACVTGKGEAECLCATLNEDGLVDGCISQDSDCFGYGAQVVYRNFSISTQGTQSASGGAVDVYDINKAYKGLSRNEINFGRNKIIAMALLLGSDYSDGVHGIGKDSVLKFFDSVPDDKVLDRIRSWKIATKRYDDYEQHLNDKNVCTACGHVGKIQMHNKNGCGPCGTLIACDIKYKFERLAIRNEVVMRNKAIQDPNFPNEFLISEFLTKKDSIEKLDLTWKQPNLVGFVQFTAKFLQWDELYSVEKILPVLTRWQCRNPDFLKDESSLKGYLIPDRIKKVRNPKGVASYEIIWSDPQGFFKGLIPDEQFLNKNVDPEKFWSTIEPQTLVETAYPDLVMAFKQSKLKPKKPRRSKKKAPEDLKEVTEKLDNISITSHVAVVVKKTKQPKPKPVKPNKDWTNIDDVDRISTLEDLDQYLTYLENLADKGDQHGLPVKEGKIRKKRKPREDLFKQAIKKSYEQTRETKENIDKNDGEIFDTLLDLSPNEDKSRELSTASEQVESTNNEAAQMSTPTKSIEKDSDMSFDPNISSFGDEDDLDLSSIIDDIVSRKFLPFDTETINQKCIENDGVIEPDEFLQCVKSMSGNLSSSFFLDEADQEDVFEKTFNEMVHVSSDDEDSDTIDNDLEDDTDKENICPCTCKKECHLDDTVDSFCDKDYVPLYERLKSKF